MGRPKGPKKEPKKEPLSELQQLAQKIGTDGSDRLVEMEAMSVEELNKRIAQANQAISESKETLEADLPSGEKNQYMKAKALAKELSSDLRDTKKRQNAIIAVAIYLRKSQGAT